MQINWVDLVIVAIIGLSMITGFIRGFIKELIALSVWLLAIWVAYHYAPMLEPSLQKYIQDKTARTIVAFVLLLLGILIAGGILNAFLSFILRGSGLSGVDRLLGMVFGFVRGVFIIALLIVIIKMTSMSSEQYFRDSQLYTRFTPVVNWLFGWVPQLISRAKALDNKFIDKDAIVDIPDVKKALDNKKSHDNTSSGSINSNNQQHSVDIIDAEMDVEEVV